MSPTEAEKPGRTAVVFDLQRLCLHDGPGLRTGVFFKGCSLRCLWCHNPESFAEAPELLFSPRLCVGCGECVAVCPTGAQSFADGGRRRVFDPAKCELCRACLEVCCYGALEVCGRSYTAPELLAEIEADRPYYAIGEGGGLTLTGGEPMLRADFIDELLDGLRGLDVRVETSGQAPRAAFERLAPRIDGFLFDYKATGDERHRSLCGEGNELILGNLDYLCRSGAEVLLRLPLVPGLNDDEAHLEAIAGLLRRYPRLAGAEILPYHDLGASKSERLGREAGAPGIVPPDEDRIAGWLSRLSRFGAPRVGVSR